MPQLLIEFRTTFVDIPNNFFIIANWEIHALPTRVGLNIPGYDRKGGVFNYLYVAVFLLNGL